MPVFRLIAEHVFPSPELAREDGLLAVGGDLHPARLLLGYSLGIFPWYSEGQPILWHAPDPRFVLFLDSFHLPRSLGKVVRKGTFELRMDTAFERVLTRCAGARRPGQRGTWITPAMKRAYLELHRMGFAHSVEAWQDGKLVGGLYGVHRGRMFFGESMFASVSEASKVAFVGLVAQLRAWDFDLLDSQVHTHHLERFGAENIPRQRYGELLAARVGAPDARPGPWSFDPDVLRGLAR